MEKNIKSALAIFFFIILASYLSFLNEDYQLEFLFSELGILEILQVIILFCGLLFVFKNYKLLKIKYSKKYIFIRILLFIFLIYEELSFLTKELFYFMSKYNIKGEFNIHNSKFLVSTMLENIPIFGDIIFDTSILSLILLVLGLGSYTKLNTKVKILFVQKELFFISIIYPLHLTLNNLFPFYHINIEFIELILYLIVSYDILLKKQNIIDCK